VQASCRTLLSHVEECGGPGVYPSLTARRNLAELARLRGYGGTAEIDDALAQVGLADVADDKVRGFSSACGSGSGSPPRC
jgi:ABC-type transport system involved in cytochrome c biogenesis ATPase subunit